MKPCSFKALHSSNYLQNIDAGKTNTIASVKGSVKKLGVKYKDALVVLYNKNGLLPISTRKPDDNGDYQICGLNNSLSCFVVAFDDAQQYNAVIQDNVIPK